MSRSIELALREALAAEHMPYTVKLDAAEDGSTDNEIALSLLGHAVPVTLQIGERHLAVNRLEFQDGELFAIADEGRFARDEVTAAIACLIELLRNRRR